MEELAFIVFMVGIIIISRIIASNIKTEKKKYESDVAQLTKECQYLREQLEKTHNTITILTYPISKFFCYVTMI